METPNTDMLRGRVDIFVLKALSENHGYGYDILNYIYTRTSGHYEMKQSSIYSVLKRLEKQGYVYSYNGGDESNGAQRRYYALTESGKQLLADQENEWAYTRTLLDNLVSNREFDLDSDTPPFRPSDLRPMTRRSSKPENGSDAEGATTDVVSESITTPEEPAVQAEAASPEPIAQAVTVTPEITVQIVEDTTVASSVASETAPISQQATEEADDEAPQASVDTPQPAVAEVDTSDEADNSSSTSAPRFSNEELEQLWQSLARRDSVEEQNPQQETAATVASTIDVETPQAPSENYRDFYGDLFSGQSERRTSERQMPREDELNCSHINDLRIKLNSEGIKLKPYEAATARKGLLQYVLVNRLFRDSVILSYLFLIAMLLVVYLCKPFQVSLNAFLIIGGLGLIAPIAALLLYFNNPSKKKKDNINIKIILSIVGIVYFTVFVISIVINLLIPNGLSLNSYATYAPCIVSLVIPFFGAVFAILYKTKNYHLKTK